MQKRAFALSVGGNLSNTITAFRYVLIKLSNHSLVNELKVSSVYKTPPWGSVEEGCGFFLNAAFSGFWQGKDAELLELCRSFESNFGCPVQKMGAARFIDIDILFIERGISTEELILPHPRMHLRRFVLVPLSDIWFKNVPGLNKTPLELLKVVQDESSIIFEGVLSLD